MAWPAAFVAALSSRTFLPRFVLRSAPQYAEPGYYAAVCSHAGLEGPKGIAGVVTESQRLQPATWSSSLGGFQVEIVGESAIRHALTYWTRGTVLELWCHPAGLPDEDAGRIGLGVLTQTRLSPGRLTVVAVDLVTATRSRMDKDTIATALFTGLPASEALTASYTAGDATLTFATTGDFDRETGGTGVVMVEPSSGEPFYLTFTGKTATDLTGVSATGKLGTTAANASTGATVHAAALLTGHPADIARKLLCSRGNSNGAFDVLPYLWGYGIDHEMIDHEDCERYKAPTAPTSGSYEWNVAQMDIVDDGYAWLTSLLGGGGFFLTMRQGAITVRCGQDPYSSKTPLEGTLYLSDLASAGDYAVDGFDGDHATEAALCCIYSASGANETAIGEVATLPAVTRRDYNLKACISTNETAARTADLARLAPLATRVPERLTADLAGRRAAAWAVGGVVEIGDAAIWTRALLTRGDERRRGILDEVRTDWMAGTVSIGLLVYPPDEEVGS